MAEFVKTLRNWRRLCKAQTPRHETEDVCQRCPLFDATDRGCASIFEDDFDDMDIPGIEYVVTDWALNHPEPVYPTWREWMMEAGLLKWHAIPNTYAKETVPDWEVLLTPIPADIARKLGIEPKEG